MMRLIIEHLLKLVLSLVLLFTIGVKVVYAQNNCEQKLKEAQATFDAGRINEVPALLENCLLNGFTKDQRISAYKLLTLNYLYSNEKAKAEEALKMFLTLNPEYKINPVVDPPEFINLYNTFRTRPIYIFGLKAGLSHLDVEVLKNFSVDNSAVARGKYKSNFSYLFGLSFDVPVYKFISINPELFLSRNFYTYSDTILNFATLEMQQENMLVQAPVLLKAEFGKDRWRPYVNVGASFEYLLRSEIDAYRRDEIEGGGTREVKNTGIDISGIRTPFNYSLVGGLGVKLKNKNSKGLWSFDVRFEKGMTNVVDINKRGSIEELIFDYGYIDNDFKLNKVYFTLGYVIPKYKPKVLKRLKDKDKLD